MTTFGARGLLVMFLVSVSLALPAQVPPSAFVEWERSYGGDETHYGAAVTEDEEGGYFVAGTIDSDLRDGTRGGDVLLIRTDATGKPRWQRTFGSEGLDSADAVASSADGTCVVAGWTESLAEETDAYLFKVDGEGHLLWERTFGGERSEVFYSINETNDGGYALAGVTNSFSTTRFNAYLVKVDAEGRLLWERSFGGESWDYYGRRL